jgi:hypothetical protein
MRYQRCTRCVGGGCGHFYDEQGKRHVALLPIHVARAGQSVYGALSDFLHRYECTRSGVQLELGRHHMLQLVMWQHEQPTTQCPEQARKELEHEWEQLFGVQCFVLQACLKRACHKWPTVQHILQHSMLLAKEEPLSEGEDYEESLPFSMEEDELPVV